MNALDAAWRELEMDALASDGPIRDSDVKDAIKRNRPYIEQEAASAAVAEVLDAAEAVIEWLGPCDHFDHHGNCQTHGVEKPCRVETLRALIASERGT